MTRYLMAMPESVMTAAIITAVFALVDWLLGNPTKDYFLIAIVAFSGSMSAHVNAQEREKAHD